jgi:hypothetical protein
MDVKAIIFLVRFKDAMLTPSYRFGLCVYSELENGGKSILSLWLWLCGWGVDSN